MNDNAQVVDKQESTPNVIKEERLLDEKVEEAGCRKIIESLSEEEKEMMSDDRMPMRYFRAEKGNVESAIKKIKATIKWREDFEVNKIKTAFEPDGDAEMQKLLSFENATGKVYVRQYDKNGRAIIYLRPGMENSKDEPASLKHLVYHLERAIACTEKNGLEKYVFIMDYTGFKLRNAPSISATKQTIHIFQNHYPERMYKAYICNPPLVFRTFWNIIKPFVDPVTKKKVVFCVGKSGEKAVSKELDLSKVEKCAFGTETLREFDSKEYLSKPLHSTFDEEGY